MAVEIHDNLKNLIKSMVFQSARYINCDGSTKSFANGYVSDDTFKTFNGIIPASNNVNSYSFAFKVGSGEKSSDADYTLGLPIKTVSGYYSNWTVNDDTVTYMASAKNTGTDDIIISEIGLFFNTSGSYSFLAAYSHLDNPITVGAGESFTVKMSLKYSFI